MMALYARHNVAPRMGPADMKLLAGNPCDLLGINYYFPHRVYASDAGGFLGFEIAPRGTARRPTWAGRSTPGSA